MRLWRIQQVQTNSAFFKFTALFAWLRMSFVWLWMGPQESKGVYKLVPVASQIFLLTVAQLFCLSRTSRSQVTLSMVTLLLISQWLRHFFRWANASASDYCIISSPLLQLYIQRVCEEREAFQHCSCSSIEGHQWLHRSKTAHACTHLCKGSIGRSRCECTTRTLLLFAGVEQKPHVQTKLDNLLVLQSLFKYRIILCFSESLKQSCLNFSSLRFSCLNFSSLRFSCLNFPLSVFITGATVNLTQDDVVLNSVVKSECDRTLEEKTRWRVNCLPWLDSFLLRQAERSSRSFARPNTFALQTSLEKALYTTGVSDASVMPTATRKFIRLRKLTDKSTSLWSMPTLWVRDTAEFIPFFWTWFLMGQNFDLLARHVFVRIAFYECVDKVLSWAKARVATSRRYLWPGYWR